jgi:uncharacterized repeat protein (TIGR02543 family)
MPNEDVTLTAQWESNAPVVNNVTVTFHYNYDGRTTYRTVTVPSGTSLGALMPSDLNDRGNYDFDGWNTRANGNGSNFTRSTVVTSDIIVYAQWDYDRPYTPTEPDDDDDDDDETDPTDGPTQGTTEGPTDPSEEESSNPTESNSETTDPTQGPTTSDTEPEPDPDPDPEEEVTPTTPTPTTADPVEPTTQPIAPAPEEDGDDVVGELVVEEPTQSASSTTIGEDEVPLINIFNNEIPLFGPVNSATWALVNLIISILGAVMALLVAIRAILLKKKKNDKDEENDENIKRNRLVWLITTIVSGVVGVLVFLFTEDMSNEMVLVDIWTIVNAVVFALGIVATIFTVKRVKKDDDKNSRQGPTSGQGRVISLSGK